VRLPRISNFDDFDPLAAESGVNVRYVSQAEDLGRPTAVILPGSKMTLPDLTWLHDSGLASLIVALAGEDIAIVGICGGYQMLGQSLADPDGVEAVPGARATGLGLLNVHTTFAGDKRTVQVRATLTAEAGPFASLNGSQLDGYEIHMGRTRPSENAVSALCRIGSATSGHDDGAVSIDGRIWGTYLHGLFDNDSLRHAWLRSLGWRSTGRPFDRQHAYNQLAEHVRANLDLATLRQIIWDRAP
jgi:adenosylcobyric acid synthase